MDIVDIAALVDIVDAGDIAADIADSVDTLDAVVTIHIVDGQTDGWVAAGGRRSAAAVGDGWQSVVGWAGGGRAGRGWREPTLTPGLLLLYTLAPSPDGVAMAAMWTL